MVESAGRSSSSLTPRLPDGSNESPPTNFEPPNRLFPGVNSSSSVLDGSKLDPKGVKSASKALEGVNPVSSSREVLPASTVKTGS